MSEDTSRSNQNLYAPENVVAFLRSIENNSIAGRQYRHAADEIERLRAELSTLQGVYDEASKLLSEPLAEVWKECATCHVQWLGDGHCDRCGPSSLSQVRWLVEHRDPAGSQRYRCMDDHGIHWTNVAGKAISFCRRSDAEQFAAGDPEDVRIVEHMFIGAAETKEAGYTQEEADRIFGKVVQQGDLLPQQPAVETGESQ